MPSRDESEVVLAVVVEESTKTFLQQVLDAVMSAIRAGRYDEAQPVLALGVMLGWWTDQVGDRVVESIKDAWQAAYGVTLAGQDIVTARADAMAFHIAAVRDRLSRSALPEIPEAAFDEVRLSQSSAALGGWNIEQQARDIAERLKWEPDKQYWKDQKKYAEDQIDKILDPLGKPGTPARTYAHKHDPEVKHWQKIRAGAVDKLREDQGDWQTRSERIARTEATAAWNSGTLAALAAEGRTHKKWVATKDPRTRESHREANGQVVRLSRPFKVGESLLMMPGDPAAPPWETINCRCTVVGADEPAKKALTAAYNPRQARVPAGNGPLSGRWLDMPDKVVDDLLADLGTRKRRQSAQDAVSWVEKARSAKDDKEMDRNLQNAENVLNYEVRTRPAYQADLDAVKEARAKIEEYRSVDWSLAEAEGDIGGSDVEKVKVGGDTAVSPEAARVLNKWVQLQGSGNLTPAEREVLRKEIEDSGEATPELYRGANVSKANFKPGQQINLGVVSASEEDGAALPYAENGDGDPVLFILPAGLRGLNVQDRASEEAGWGEEDVGEPSPAGTGAGFCLRGKGAPDLPR